VVDTDKVELDFTMKEGLDLPTDDAFNISNSGQAGTLSGVSVSADETWVTATLLGDGNGNSQNVTVEINSNAQALAAGDYTAQIEVESANAINTPYYITVNLTVEPLVPFTLNPVALSFDPGRDWEVPPPQQVDVAATGEGGFAAPVTVTSLPDWLQATVDATDPDNQVITFTPLYIPADEEDFAAIVLVTGSYTAELPVSMVVPAYFRRPNCQMDFIPRIEGTIIDECDVPPPPPPVPRTIPIPPPLPAPTYPMSINISGPPCIECSAWIEYEDEEEVGYGKPRIEIECDDHGCDGDNLQSGTYGSENNTPGGTTGQDYRVITALEIDECGHVCGIWFEEVAS
jgi:hypothetical protein